MSNDQTPCAPASTARAGDAPRARWRRVNVSGLAAPSRRLLVRGGTVVTPCGRIHADILVAGEQIAAIGAPGGLGAADVVIEADGLLVLPGLVDAHVHVRDPGFPAKEDFGSAGRAAAAGGITTMVVMPHDDPVAASADLLLEKATLGAAASVVDFALLGAVGSQNIGAISAMAAAGAVAVEAWLVHSPDAVGPVNAWDLRRIMHAALDASVPVGVYCETTSITAGATQALRQADRRDAAAHGKGRPGVAEALGAALASVLAEETGASVHLRQLSTAAAIAAADDARARGADVTVEVTPHHIVLDEDAAAAGGPELKMLPPLRSRADVQALRAAVLDGGVDMVASDHAPHALADKAAGKDNIWQSPAGVPGLETLLSVLLTEFGTDAPEVVARACSDVPARRFGLGSRKGRIAPGLDADLVLVDPGSSWTVVPKKLKTRASQSPFAGRRLKGAVQQVVRRGEVIVVDGEPVAHNGGQWIRRRGNRPR